MFYKIIITTSKFNLVTINFDQEVDLLKNDLLKNYGIDMRVKIRYTRNFTKVTMLDKQLPPPGDWQTEFQFRTCGADNSGLFLKFIRLPKAKQSHGLGSYCVHWLENFAESYGFKYIVFSSKGTAQGFWRKMGYQYTEDTDLIQQLYFG